MQSNDPKVWEAIGREALQWMHRYDNLPVAHVDLRDAFRQGAHWALEAFYMEEQHGHTVPARNP